MVWRRGACLTSSYIDAWCRARSQQKGCRWRRKSGLGAAWMGNLGLYSPTRFASCFSVQTGKLLKTFFLPLCLSTHLSKAKVSRSQTAGNMLKEPNKVRFHARKRTVTETLSCITLRTLEAEAGGLQMWATYCNRPCNKHQQTILTELLGSGTSPF